MAFTFQHACELLSAAQRSGRLPHALLVTGSASSGTHELALFLARKLNGCRAETLESLRHPMCRVLSPGSKSRRILIDDMRSIEPFLQLKADPGKTKFVAIVEADRINEQAANAFLKTLEEPPAQTLIVLITAHPSRLLATILSRCIRLDLRDAAGEPALTEVQRQFLPSVVKALEGMGSDLAALALRTALLDFLAQRRESITNSLQCALKDEAKAISVGTGVKDWEASRKEENVALIETEYLAERTGVLDLLSLCLGQSVLLASHAPDVKPLALVIRRVAEQFPVKHLIRRMKAVDALRRDLEFNVHEGLAVDRRLLEAFGASPA